MRNHLRSLFRRKRPFNLAEQRADAWVQRAEDAASLVALIPGLDQPFSVVDLGAGDKKLFAALASKYRVTYTGYDKLPQSDDIHPWDADQGLPNDLGDVCFALGLLEYIRGIADVFRAVSSAGRHFIFSYVTSDSGRYDTDKIARLGWKTHHSSAEIEQLLHSADLRIVTRLDSHDYSLWLTSSPNTLTR